MTFEEICNRKGGKFTSGVGCLLDDYVGHSGNRSLYNAVFKHDFPHRTDNQRLFYETTKLKCEKNGDEFVSFGAGEPADSEESLPVVQVCRELGASEYCKKKDMTIRHDIVDERVIHDAWGDNWHKSLEGCMSTVQFPEHKLEGFFETHDEKTHLVVIKKQVLHSTLITTVMQSFTNDKLATLYEYQALNPTQVDTAIRNVRQHGKGQIRGLCKNKKIRLTEVQIDELIKSKWFSGSDAINDLGALYSYYHLTSKQVDRAIEKGISVDKLIEKRLVTKFTDAQITKIIKMFGADGGGNEVYALYSKKGVLKPKHIDLMLGINPDGTTNGAVYVGYIAIVYEHQMMTPRQIDRAIELGTNREVLYLHQKLEKPQVTKALARELDEERNTVHKENLFTRQSFTDTNIDFIIEHAKTHNEGNNLTMFMARQQKRLTKPHLKQVIDYADSLNENTTSNYNRRNYSDDIIDSLFLHQNADSDIINYCIEKHVSLEMIYNNHGGLFKKTNIDNAIKVGKHVGILYLKAKLTNTQIMSALKKKDEIESLIRSEKSILNEGHIRYLIRTGSKEEVEYLYQNYARGKNKKILSEKNIDAAMERAFGSEHGDGLHALYQNNALYGHQLTDALVAGKEMRALYCNTSNVFSDDDLRYAILNDKELANLYTCQTKLPSGIIDLAMEHRMNLHELYEFQTFSPAQLLTALSIGIEIQQIITNHLSSFQPVHFDVLIPNADDQLLFMLYRDESYQLSDKQREMISKRFKDKTGMDIPPKSLVHQMLNPSLWLEYETKKQRNIAARIPETPFTSIIGTYSLALTNPWQEIIDVVKKEGYLLSPDGKYAIETETTFAARQRKTLMRDPLHPIPNDAPRLEHRVGKLLGKLAKPSMIKKHPELAKPELRHELEIAVETSPLLWQFKKLESRHIRPLHFTEEFTDITPEERGNLEIVITNDPNSIAAKGAGTKRNEDHPELVPPVSGGHVHIKTGCETVKTGPFGWKEWSKAQLAGKEAGDGGCGWCDDIKNNNVIAILQHKGTPTFFPDDAGPLDPKTGRHGEWHETFKNSKGEQERMTPSKKWYARAMIRWCVREDNKKVDAILETVYGGEPVCKCHGKAPKTEKDSSTRGYVAKYREIFESTVTNILRENGFTAKRGRDIDGHPCKTPYHFTGYADKATMQFPRVGATLKTYNLAE